MAQDEKLSPEEKLLKVIRETKEEAGTAAEPTKPGEEPAGAHVRLAAVDAHSDDGATIQAGPSGGGMLGEEKEGAGEEPMEDAGEVLEDSPSVAAGLARKLPLAQFSVGTTNRVLAAVSVIMLLLCAFEVWANARRFDAVIGEGALPRLKELQATPPSKTPDGTQAAAAEKAAGETDFGKVLAAYANKDIFRAEDDIAQISDKDKGPKPPSIGDSFHLIGIAGTGEEGEGQLEAIVLEKAAQKLHFVVQGSEIPMADKTKWTVVSISTKGVTLTDGKQTVTIE